MAGGQFVCKSYRQMPICKDSASTKIDKARAVCSPLGIKGTGVGILSVRYSFTYTDL